MSSINRLRQIKSRLLQDTFGSDSDNENDLKNINKTKSNNINIKGRVLLKEKLENEIFSHNNQESDSESPINDHVNTNESLLMISHKLRQDNKLESEFDIIQKEEESILQDVSHSLTSNLQSVNERAKGINHIRLPSIWKIPNKYNKLTIDQINRIRAKNYIEINGNDIPAPIRTFKDFKFPRPILKYLSKRNIKNPTQIQMQGIPSVLQGRDLIAIAYTGSGKTLVFILPMIMLSWEYELKSKILQGEGPFALVLCPSRELAIQTCSIIQEISDFIFEYKKINLHTLSLIGGVNIFEQSDKISKGIHMLVSTPGRLIDFLNNKRMTLSQCVYFCMDEADRLLDLGFDDEIRSIINHLDGPRQTLLFSATMPKKIQEFAINALIDPVVINIGRAGAANLNVTQDIEWVQQEMRLPMLLSSLQKSPPPVLIFCDNKRDVDEIHEYLLLKGIEATAIHSGLAMNDRLNSIRQFRNGDKDVLVSTAVASKGLDFPDIKHVINFDMPREIEDYVHMIGRTGRSNRKGLSTTFIHKGVSQIVLMDLKTLLIEARQKIPDFLKTIDSKGLNLKSIGGQRGCAFCSGLGHRISECPKLKSHKHKINQKNRDLVSSGSRYNSDKGYSGDW